MRLHALIPARAGSRRLPGKNMKSFAGRPLIEWTIEAAIRSALCERVCVSTDDPAILLHAEGCGCDSMPLRPAELATDEASSLDLILHYLHWQLSVSQDLPDRLLLLQPTSPLRDTVQIQQAVACSLNHQGRELVSVTQPAKPATWLHRTNGEFLGETLVTQKEEVVLLNGALYLLDCARLLRERRLLGPDPLFWRMSRETSVDIDDRMDWLLAEALVLHPEEDAA